MTLRRCTVLGFTLAIGLTTWTAAPSAARAELPSRLTGPELWQLSESFSEPNGTFASDNLVSNETVFAQLVPELQARTKPGGVYMGVGPEQNFTYIAAMKPRMAFIVDVRRGNMHMHLMYKALFELAPTRADFVARLFTKKRPDGLSPSTTGPQLMAAFWDVFTGSEAEYDQNLQAIRDQLIKDKLPISEADFAGIASVYRTFYWYGLAISYNGNVRLTGTGQGTSYAALMSQLSPAGESLSYLGTEEKYLFLKDLETKNMLVPAVGNFAGPKALRAVGAYIREHGATVSAYYVSNVEQYLKNGLWTSFCGNVATMPLDAASVFIRPTGSYGNGAGAPMASTVLTPGMYTMRTTGAGPARAALWSMTEDIKTCK